MLTVNTRHYRVLWNALQQSRVTAPFTCCCTAYPNTLVYMQLHTHIHTHINTHTHTLYCVNNIEIRQNQSAKFNPTILCSGQFSTRSIPEFSIHENIHHLGLYIYKQNATLYVLVTFVSANATTIQRVRPTTIPKQAWFEFKLSNTYTVRY
jgi:hypothetical protein